MVDIEIGDNVKWIEPLTVVPSPDGMVDSNGVILPVLRDREITGVVTGSDGEGRKKTLQVRIDALYDNLPLSTPSSYDLKLDPSRLTKI
jgi:hypothetical protein